ncbi:MAG: hypothetical protein AB8F34_05755 [Akkermansiaceae bacterium]
MPPHLDNIGLSTTAWGKLIGIDRSTASRLLRGKESSIPTTSARQPRLYTSMLD